MTQLFDTQMARAEFNTRVVELIRDQFLIEPEDCVDEAMLCRAFDNGETPDEFVHWLGEKYDLEIDDPFFSPRYHYSYATECYVPARR